MTHPTRCGMSAEQVRPGMQVRVMEPYTDERRRNSLRNPLRDSPLVGTVVACYGAEDYVAVDVRLEDGRYGLFWPSDLEEIHSPRASRWRSLLGRRSGG